MKAAAQIKPNVWTLATGGGEESLPAEKLQITELRHSQESHWSRDISVTVDRPAVQGDATLAPTATKSTPTYQWGKANASILTKAYQLPLTSILFNTLVVQLDPFRFKWPHFKNTLPRLISFKNDTFLFILYQAPRSVRSSCVGLVVKP